MPLRANSWGGVGRGACVGALGVVFGIAVSFGARGDDPPGGDDLLPRTARVEDAGALGGLGVGRVVPDLTVTALRGEKHAISGLLTDRKALVLAVTGATCPVAMKYSARLAAMEEELGARGVGFVFINGVDAELDADMARQVQRYRFKGAYIPDRDRALCKALGVRTTTEVFVLDAGRTLVYRGAIDDQYGINVALDAPKNQYLRDGVESALGGFRARVRATYAPGCLVSLPTVAMPDGRGASSVTYTKDIAWILAENCVSCHRPGGAGPFALDSYAAVAGRAKMVRAVVGDGLMPPWHGSAHEQDEVGGGGGASPWVNDRSLSRGDREKLLAWLGTGPTPARGEEGELPMLPALSRTWAIGEPDLLVTTSGFRLAAQGGLRYARVQVGFIPTEDKWVSALEFRPVESGSMHHALVWVLAPGDVLPKPEEMPARLELLGTYSPGDNVIRYPTGAARRIRAGSIFLVDVYARPMGKEVISALRIALKWGDEPKWSVRSVGAGAKEMLAGGEAGGFRAAVDLPLPADARVLSITPYLRSLGRGYVVEGDATKGVRERVIEAVRHDFRWVIRYEFVEPRGFATPGLALTGQFKPDAESGAAPKLGSGAKNESLLMSVELLEPNPSPRK